MLKIYVQLRFIVKTKNTEKHAEIPVCVGSHKLDYRPAWQVDKPIKKMSNYKFVHENKSIELSQDKSLFDLADQVK